MCSVGSSKDIAAGAGMNRAIGGAQGVGVPAFSGGTALTGARRVLARPNTMLGGGSSGGSTGGGIPRNPRPTNPGQAEY
jgi:hypothetical protein